MNFEVVGKVSDVETIAVGSSIRILPVLRRRFGKGRWRKLKGVAQVRLSDGTVRLAELHWFEAHGVGKKLMTNQTIPRLKVMAKRKDTTPRFAICIHSDDADLLTPRMIYQVLPDESAAKSNYVRVVDNEGEDYLYPAEYFAFVDFPHEIERALLRASR